MAAPGEFDLIERIRRRVVGRDDVVLGIGDDAAVLTMPPGMQLVVAMDTLNAGVHFPHDTPAADIGWKALAVNLSDLGAMGATPAWCTLSLSMPASDPDWLDAFIDGFTALATRHGVALVGGDTTRGPLSVCVTVHGFVAPGCAMRRSAAREGDDVWVTGTLGDAAGGLRCVLPEVDRDARIRTDAACDALRSRLDRPVPRVDLGRALQPLAHACIDVSDGLLADLAHVAHASGIAIEIDINALPCSDALAHAFDPATVRRLQATGGDDYELAFTAPASARAAIDALADAHGVRLSRIGRVVVGNGVEARANGAAWMPARAGFDHFAPASGSEAATPARPLPSAEQYAAERTHYGAGERVDIGAAQRAVEATYSNQVLLDINDACLRMSVFEGEYRWHRHPDSDELFLVVAGELRIDFDDGTTAVLTPWHCLVVPAGAVHRTRAIGRTVNVTFEKQAARTEFVDDTTGATTD